MRAHEFLFTESKIDNSYLSEEGPVGDGDCFHVAGRAMIDMTDEQEVYGMKLVHAFVYGQGPLKGRRFEHAWNEQGSTCLDNSNGQKTVMNKKQYYKLAGVVKERGAYASYNKDETIEKMLDEQHWGPWDLSTMLGEKVPVTGEEVGKKKLKISSKELLQIKQEQ
jgi:hypothetical protein